MREIRELGPYQDDDGNVIESEELDARDVKVTFRGRGNRLVLSPGARVRRLHVTFDCDNGRLEIAASSLAGGNWGVRVGQDVAISIGEDVTTTGLCILSAAEGVSLTIGRDVMIATGVQIRADDGHPIFDVRTGKRVNPSKSVVIGDHVWLGMQAAVLAGATIGSGSAIGYGSVVKGRIPNNCVAAGAPARVVRRDVVWERPHLTLAKPYFKPDATAVARSHEFWADTDEGPRRRGRMPRLRSLLRKR